jgi:hypothetical protein
MLDRVKVELIAKNINEKLKLKDSKPSIKDTLKKINPSAQNLNGNLAGYVNLLLITACEFNFLQEFHELLALQPLENIDQPIMIENSEEIDNWRDNGKPLLGLAAFHGQIEIVKYLIEVKLANINAKDVNGNSPLHQVVYGDSYPFNHYNFGNSHESVAEYLIQNGGDLSVKNNKQETPYDCTKTNAPLSIENMVGRRFITNTDPARYYADKVRPVFEERLKRLERAKNDPTIFLGVRTNRTEAKDYEIFRLEQAVEEYVCNNKISYGYISLNQLIGKLDNLSEKEWAHFRMVISSNKPAPYSFKYRPIWDQIPNITKKSALIGLIVSIGIYYVSHDILKSVASGFLSAYFAWQILTELACKNNSLQRDVQENRVNNLLQHDRFLKPIPRRISEIRQLNHIQNELDQLGSNYNLS